MIHDNWLRLLHWQIFLLAGFFCFRYAGLVQAQVIISEVYPAPNSDEVEWIELYNTEANQVSLAHWSLLDQLKTPSLIKQFSATAVIEGQQTIIVRLAKAKLNNSGDGVTLKDETGETVDQTSFPQAKTGFSWTRQNLTSPQFSWQRPSMGAFNQLPLTLTPTLASTTVTPTPSITFVVQPTPNPTPTLTPTPSPPLDIQLTELVACPAKGQPEWLEIKNKTTSNVDVDFELKDKSGNRVNLKGQLTPLGYTVLELDHNILNNDGDSISLTDQNHRVLDQLTFPACTKNSSYAFINGRWLNTEQVSKGRANPNVTVTTTPTSSPTPTAELTTTATLRPSLIATESQSTSNGPLLELQPTKLTTFTAQTSKLNFPSLKLETSRVGTVLGDQSSQEERSTSLALWSVISGIIGGSQLFISGAIFYAKQY